MRAFLSWLPLDVARLLPLLRGSMLISQVTEPKPLCGRKCLRRALLVAVTGLLLLLVAEVCLRLIRPDLVASRQLQTIADPFIGWRYAPNQSWQGRTETGQPRHVRSNLLGFADVDHDLQADRDTFRVAFLGDSFVAGLHVDFHDTLCSVSVRTLISQRGGKSAEALNFGHSGFGTVNEYLSWKYYAAPFRPDAVVLAFFLGNDVANNLVDYPTESFRSPKFTLVNSQLQALPFHLGASAEAERRQRRSWWYRTFLEPAVLYQQYKLLERDLRHQWRGDRRRETRPEETQIPFWKRAYAPRDWQTYLPDPDEDFQKAWAVTEALLLRLGEEVRGSGARFYVALLPGLERMQPEEFQKSLTRYPGAESIRFDLDFPRQRLLRFLKTHSIPAIDITAEFEKRVPPAERMDLYFHFDRHFSVRGHRIAGEAIGGQLAHEFSGSQETKSTR